MPKRRYVKKRRRTFKRRRPQYRRKIRRRRAAYKKPIGTVYIRRFPSTHLTTQVVWNGQGTLNIPTTGVGTKRYIANNIWDPVFDTVSQYSFYTADTMRVLYSRYLVLGSEIRVVASNPDNTNVSAFGILKTSDPAVTPELTDWDDYRAQRGFRYSTLGVKNQSQALKAVTNKFSLKNDLGVMSINPVETTSAKIDNSPTTQYYFIVVGAPFIDGVTDNENLQFQVQIKFTVLFTGLKHIEASET